MGRATRSYRTKARNWVALFLAALAALAQPVRAQNAEAYLTEISVSAGQAAGWVVMRAEIELRNGTATSLDLSGLDGRVEILEDELFPYLPEMLLWNGDAPEATIALESGQTGQMTMIATLPEVHGSLAAVLNTGLGAVAVSLVQHVQPPTVPEPVATSQPPPDVARQFAIVPEDEVQESESIVSWADFGANLAFTRGSTDDDVLRMINGLTALDETVVTFFPDSAGEIEFVLTFPQGRLTQLSHLVIDSRTRSAHSYVPGQVGIAISDSGAEGPWTDLGVANVENQAQHRLVLGFAEAQAARAVRITIKPLLGLLRLSEIEAFQVADPAGGSVLDDVTLNLADQHYGAHIVRFTSHTRDHEASALLSPEGDWIPGDDQLPQDFVIAFGGYRSFPVSEITLDWHLPPSSDWTPRVRLQASTGPGPLESYRDLGVMEILHSPGADFGQTRMRFSDPVPIRWLRVTLSDPGTPDYALRQLSVTGRAVDYLHRERGEPAIPSEPACRADEAEPNDSPADAFELVMNARVCGTSGSMGDEDYFSFTVPEGPARMVNFHLRGSPWIRVHLDLLGPDGELLFSQPPLTAEAERHFSWRLAPGTYGIHLSQPPASIAILIDDSGSMGDAIQVAKQAARLFVLTKRPDERISLFRFSGPVRQLSALTTDSQALERAVLEGIDQSEPGGTSIYDAIEAGIASLAGTGGNRAVILLTDGMDVSGRPYASFWDMLERERVPVFSIGLGNAIRQYSWTVSARPDQMFRGVARGTGGAYFDSPTADDLPIVWQDIARTIRARGSYEISWSIGGDGSFSIHETGDQFVAASALGGIHFVFDASGSMAATTDQGRRRIDVARSLMLDILSEVPSATPIGLRIYGANLPSDPAEASCLDSVLVVPPARGSAKAVEDAVLSVEPRGQTPIGRSLALVPEDLGEDGRALVIVITDGEETCDADPDDPFNPERVAESLIAQGLDVRVNVVGFDIGDPAINAGLARIAQAANGDFRPANGEAGLRAALNESLVQTVTLSDDLGQIIARTRVGAARVTLPVGQYSVSVAEIPDLVPRQTVEADREARVFLSREGEEVRVTSENVLPDDALPGDVSTIADPVLLANAEIVQRLLVRSTPRRAPVLLEERVYSVQALLSDLGFHPGPADGSISLRTRLAAGKFLARYGLSDPSTPAFDADGNPTQALWDNLVSVHSARLLTPLRQGQGDTAEIQRLREAGR